MKTLAVCLFLFPFAVCAQVGIGVEPPHASSELEIMSDKRGLLIPRLTDANMTAMSASGIADQGLLIFNTTQSAFYYYNGTSWGKVGGNCIEITDEDGDTRIEVEQSADEDKIRITAAGTEVFEADNTGIKHKAGTLKTSNGTIVIENQYSLPLTDGNSGYVLSVNNSGDVTWRNPAAALGLVVGIETSSFTNVMATHNIANDVYYVRVMPWSNIKVTQMSFFMLNSVGNIRPELGIYNSGLNLLSSGTSAIIPGPATTQIVEVTLDDPVELIAGQIYWFGLVDRLNGALTAYRYTAQIGAEFSCRIQSTQAQLPNPAILGSSDDKSFWMAAY